MPPWLQTFFQWMRAEPSRPMFFGAVAILGLLYVLRALYLRLERRIADRLEAYQQAAIQTHINTTSAEIRTAARSIMEEARNHRIPIQVVAGSEEEAEGLRLILERRDEPEPEPEVARPRPRRPRRTPPPPPESENAPTAWTRILADDEDVEEAPCPTNEPPEPPPKKARAKSRRTR